jgi:hypothetical protein
LFHVIRSSPLVSFIQFVPTRHRWVIGAGGVARGPRPPIAMLPSCNYAAKRDRAADALSNHRVITCPE